MKMIINKPEKTYQIRINACFSMVDLFLFFTAFSLAYHLLKQHYICVCTTGSYMNFPVIMKFSMSSINVVGFSLAFSPLKNLKRGW